MKRKRKSHTIQRAEKRQRCDNDSRPSLSCPLLRQYYPEVLTLRQYLASRSSKKQRRKLLQYGLPSRGGDVLNADPKLTFLLDKTIVGTFERVPATDDAQIDREVSVFTQQLEESSILSGLTQGTPKQTEVRGYFEWLRPRYTL